MPAGSPGVCRLSPWHHCRLSPSSRCKHPCSSPSTNQCAELARCDAAPNRQTVSHANRLIDSIELTGSFCRPGGPYSVSLSQLRSLTLVPRSPSVPCDVCLKLRKCSTDSSAHALHNLHAKPTCLCCQGAQKGKDFRKRFETEYVKCNDDTGVVSIAPHQWQIQRQERSRGPAKRFYGRQS